MKMFAYIHSFIRERLVGGRLFEFSRAHFLIRGLVSCSTIQVRVIPNEKVFFLQKWKSDFHFSIFSGFVRNKNMHFTNYFAQGWKVTLFWKTLKNDFLCFREKKVTFSPRFFRFRSEQKHAFKNYEIKKWK